MFQDLNPLDRPTAVMEIIIMLLVAAILGYLLSFISAQSNKGKLKADIRFREDTIANLNKRNDVLEKDNTELERMIIGIRNSKNVLVEEMATLKSKGNSELNINGVNVDKLGEEISQLQKTNETLTEKNQQLEEQLDTTQDSEVMELNVARLQEKIKILEHDRNSWIEKKREMELAINNAVSTNGSEPEEMEALKQKVKTLKKEKNTLKDELAATASNKIIEKRNLLEKQNSETSIEDFEAKNKTLLDSIGTSSESDKSNLAEIIGIGPFIEAKLNSIGIFSYQQLTNLKSPEIELVTELIEFFPGRIKRDEWVAQAEQLLEKENV